MREFSANGHRVVVVANRYPRTLPAHDRTDGVEIVRMLFPTLYLGSFKPVRVLKYLSGLMLWVINFCRISILLLREKPDVVNCHFLGSQAPLVVTAAKLLGIRVVVTLHGDDVEGLPKRSRLDGWLFQNILKSADYITACSRYLMEQAIDIEPSINNKSHQIWNGIRSEDFINIEAYKYPRPYIFAAGRFVQKKGFDILLRAYDRLREKLDLDLVLAGDGPEGNNLEILAAELKLAIKTRNDEENPLPGLVMWGRASRDEIGRLMKGAELLVVPSRKEPFGIVALEGVACGCKVVACAVGGLKEIEQELPSGIVLCAPENDEGLFMAILENMHKKETRDKVYLNDWSWSKRAAEYLAVYQAKV